MTKEHKCPFFEEAKKGYGRCVECGKLRKGRYYLNPETMEEELTCKDCIEKYYKR